jgi:membrane-associated PAP2 superfamily phosphatase
MAADPPKALSMHRTAVPGYPLARVRQIAGSGFTARHLWLPLVAASLLFSVLVLGGDHWIADRIFAMEGGHWLLRDAWMTSTLMHKGGKWLSAFATLVVLVLCFHQWRHGSNRPLRWALLYLVLAVALGTGAVSLLKSLTHMDCPWDLLRYGGQRPFVGLLQARPAALPAAACFPAGQASAGYAWVSLYFFALLWRPAWRWHGLAIGLLAGITLGLAQQLRGAHFMSHDAATLIVCWLLSLGLHALTHGYLQRPSARPAGARA